MTMEHIKRHFKVSLQILHPSIATDQITLTLDLVPSRTTPAGPPRNPPFDQSFWSHDFDCDGLRDLVPIIAKVADRLEPHAAFLNSLIAAGGQAELFCGIFIDVNWDEQIPADLMGRLAALGVDLRLDAYPVRG
jgi:hypothetical protein